MTRVALVLFTGILCIASTIFAAESPGNWQVKPDVLVSGTTTPLELIYTNGRNALPAMMAFKVVIEPLSVKTLRFCPPSTGLKLNQPDPNNYPVILEPQPVHGVGFREVTIRFPKGLAAGMQFNIEIGNENTDGNLVALINPVPAHNIVFETYSDLSFVDADSNEMARDEHAWTRGKNDKNKLIDWQQAGWAKDAPHVSVAAQPASHLRLFAPSLIRTGSEFDLKIAVTDPFDSAAFPVYQGSVVLDINVPAKGLPAKIEYTQEDLCSKTIKKLSLDKSGVYRIRARLADSNAIFESNPIVVRDSVEQPVYWGLIHNHGWYSEDWGDDLDTFYRFARDISGLDYASLSDHRAAIPTKGQGVSRLLRWRLDREVDSLFEWQKNLDKAQEYNSKSFVTLIGYEWSSMDAGHNNIYFDDANIADIGMYFLPKYSDYGFAMRQLLHSTGALFIPHKHAEIFPYYTLVEVLNKDGKPLTPVIEVYSDWGEAFYPFGRWNPESLYGGLRMPLCKSYLWAIENHYKLGAIGDSDSHTGLPGRRNPGGLAPEHKHPQGLTAISTARFDRKGVMDAYRDRHTYATTGERIFLEVKALAAHMGDTLRTDKPFDIEVTTAGTDIIESVSLYKGLTLVAAKTLDGKREGTVLFSGIMPEETEHGYVAAVVQKNENRAFSSPVWVQKTSVADLSWETNDKGVWLVNGGAAAVSDVTINCDSNEYPFVLPATKARECSANEQAGFVWTDQRSNTQTILHYRWHGPPLAGTIKISGVKSCEFDFNRDFIFFKKKFEDKGNGFAEFTTGPMNSPQHSQGIDVVLTVDANKPCIATVTFEKEVTTIIGDKTVKAAAVTIPISGRTTDRPLKMLHSGRLDAEQKWFAGKAGGYYAADPNNTIIEVDENNNLIFY